jgi:hypothetical protein
MVTVTPYLQGTSDTEIDGDAGDKVQFAGAGGFDSKINVDEYQDTTHVKTAGGTDKSDGNTPNNVKFISQAAGGGGDSQADWGDGVEDLDQITDAEATLLINIADAGAFGIESQLFYAYQGSPATPPTDVDVRAAEVGDTNFTQAEGSGSALAIGDSGSAMSHDIYIALSCSPESLSQKLFTFRYEGVAT